LIFLLDTNVVSDLIRGDPGAEGWLSRRAPEDRVITCTIVRGEILHGVSRLPGGKRRQSLRETVTRLFSWIQCEPVAERAADFYAQMKLDRQRRGPSLDENDLWIAATARALNATLVTRDSDFAEINGLTVVAPQ
jgi:predicted nucleic acid-binding protein